MRLRMPQKLVDRILGARVIWTVTLALVGILLALPDSSNAQASNQMPGPILLAHYMPWFSNKAISGKWGWHWTMNHFDPDVSVGGRQEAASKYRPLIGLYDSGDPDVLEYHVLLMKLAGFDGVAIDWYGLEDYYDYATVHRNTQRLVKALQKAHMKFTLVYEDQTVTQLIKGKVYGSDEAIDKGKQLFSWLEVNWFGMPSYLQIEKRPVLMVFGPQFYKDDDWAKMFSGLKTQPDFFTLMFKRGPAVGGFSWPTPQKGELKSWDELAMFNKRSAGWKASIGVAYPRFNDTYAEASLPGYPVISDNGGKTYRQTFDLALANRSPIVQVATWNDWGEGTQIEPSIEFGYRDLETTQECRRSVDKGFAFKSGDLRVPLQLYNLRKAAGSDDPRRARLDTIARLLYDGKVDAARAALTGLER